MYYNLQQGLSHPSPCHNAKDVLIAFQDCDSQRVGGTVKIQPNSPGMPSTPHCQPPPKIHYPSFKDLKQSTIKYFLWQGSQLRAIFMHVLSNKRKDFWSPVCPVVQSPCTKQNSQCLSSSSKTKDNWLNTAGNKAPQQNVFFKASSQESCHLRPLFTTGRV